MTERFTSKLSRDKSSEQEKHELAVIDAAVRGAATSRPEDAALTDFALKLSAARLLPNDGFYREMDERFGVKADAPARKKRSRRGVLVGSGAGALVAVAAVLVVLGTQTRSDVVSAVAGDGTIEVQSISAPSERASSQKALAQDAAGLASPRASSGASGRKVEQNVSLELAAPHTQVESVADRVIGVTDRYHGYVEDSEISGGDAAGANASFSLQIPATDSQAALADLSQLAHIRSRSQSTRDVTRGYNHFRSELSDARAHRDRIAAQLAKAPVGSREAAALKLQLRAAQRALAVGRAEMRSVRNRVNYVAMSVDVMSDESAAADDRGALARAFDTAGKVLTGIAAALVIVFAIALPFAIVALIAWALIKRSRRTRRDAALDAAAGPSEA